MHVRYISDDGRHDLLDSDIFTLRCFEDRIIPTNNSIIHLHKGAIL